MKKLFLLLSLVVSMSASAGEVVIDTGKGGLRAVLTIEGMDGPFDFAKNKGPLVDFNPRLKLTLGEAMFNANLEGTTAVLIQKLLVMHSKGNEPVTAEILADEMLKTNGFTLDRAIKFNGPPPPVEIGGATVATYKASGQAVYGKETREGKRFMIVQVVSFPGNTKGYAIMATVVEKDVANFDADPALYEKRTKGGFMPLHRGLRVTQN